jgi:transposase
MRKEASMARRSRRRFSEEFKAEAIRLVQQSDEPLAKIAKDLGVHPRSLRDWLEAVRPPTEERLTEDERSELQRLRRENRQLRVERDILKKATAFFARHSE